MFGINPNACFGNITTLRMRVEEKKQKEEKIIPGKSPEWSRVWNAPKITFLKNYDMQYHTCEKIRIGVFPLFEMNTFTAQKYVISFGCCLHDMLIV